MEFILPEGPDSTSPNGDPVQQPIVTPLARAKRCQEMPDAGEVASVHPLTCPPRRSNDYRAAALSSCVRLVEVANLLEAHPVAAVPPAAELAPRPAIGVTSPKKG
jgi:hypothetical protein